MNDDIQEPPVDEQSLVKSDQYQALFLTNGQVYFGRLWILPEINVYVLNDVYYFQTETEPDADHPVKLIKLGEELHGPEDAIHVKERQVMFWENLRPDGKVAEVIEQFKDG